MGLLAFINHYFAKKGDYFRVDKPRRTLELCQVGRAFTGNDILAFTEVLRWYRRGPGWAWEWTWQTCVLVHTLEGHVEQYPLVRETVVRLFRARLVDQLVQIFEVPIRRVRLNRRASRALKDC